MITSRHLNLKSVQLVLIVTCAVVCSNCSRVSSVESSDPDLLNAIQSEKALQDFNKINKSLADRFVYEDFIKKYPNTECATWAEVEIAVLDFNSLSEGKMYRLSPGIKSWETFWKKYRKLMSRNNSLETTEIVEDQLYPMLVKSAQLSDSFDVWLEFIRQFQDRPEAETFIKSSQQYILEQPVNWDTLRLTGIFFDHVENDSMYSDFVENVENQFYRELIHGSKDLNENLTFLKNFPNSKYKSEIEDKFYTLMVTYASFPEDAYKFLGAFPDSQKKHQALQKIENMDFDYALNTPDKVKALKEFIEQYPNSERRLEAEGIIEKSAFDKALESKSERKIEEFLSLYPESKFRERALKEISRIKEDRVVYDKLLGSLKHNDLIHDINCMNDFMTNYPSNKFYPEVEQSLSTARMKITLDKISEVLRSPRDDNAPQMTPDEIVSKYEQAVVYIETDLGSGTGFIITEQGHLITNNHVIENAKTIKIYTKHNAYTPKVIHVSRFYDLAILKISGIFTPAVLGNTRYAIKGERVVVIGHPKGLSYTVSDGLLSSLPRRYNNRNSEYFQISAPISAGSSGGPVFNMYGHVIGVASEGRKEFVKSDGSAVIVDKAENLNFALSISDAIPDIVEAIRKDSIITHPIIKIEMSNQ